jgi:DNA-directed RNA polymerase subunit RPC12/RpoP
MAEPTLTPAQRAAVVAFANRHGPTLAARRFHVPVGSVKAWQVRARVRAAKARAWQEAAAQARPEPIVADTDPAEATIAQRMAGGVCLRCGGAGRVHIPEVRRGSLLIRRARKVRCPDCGGPVRIQVTEWPKAEWTEAMALAGDAGFGKCIHGEEQCGWCADG